MASIAMLNNQRVSLWYMAHLWWMRHDSYLPFLNMVIFQFAIWVITSSGKCLSVDGFRGLHHWRNTATSWRTASKTYAGFFCGWELYPLEEMNRHRNNGYSWRKWTQTDSKTYEDIVGNHLLFPEEEFWVWRRVFGLVKSPWSLPFVADISRNWDFTNTEISGEQKPGDQDPNLWSPTSANVFFFPGHETSQFVLQRKLKSAN